MYFRLGMAALLAGIFAGIVLSAVQVPFVTPLILEAERYEAAAIQNPAHEHAHEHAAPAHVFSERTLLTLGANLLAAISFALLLNAGLGLAGEGGWRVGLFWGLGGFAAFYLGPAIGLPPELPGKAAADLFARQLWWLGAAVATGAGLFLCVRFRKPFRALVAGVLLILLPHAIGAPEAGTPGSAPESLARAFIAVTLFANLLFWVTLGVASGILQARLVQGARC